VTSCVYLRYAGGSPKPASSSHLLTVGCSSVGLPDRARPREGGLADKLRRADPRDVCPRQGARPRSLQATECWPSHPLAVQAASEGVSRE
jgi:hypothetical protein